MPRGNPPGTGRSPRNPRLILRAPLAAPINRPPNPRALAALVLSGIFIFRLGFGLTSEFWSEDERQTFLIGLRAFARGAWPFFGPDVVWTQSRIPGALEGLLIAVPLSVARLPEAPFLLLNILSFAALVALGEAIARRTPQLPRWLIRVWVLTLPWTVHFSGHIVNTSYVLPASIVFFLGFFEAVPALSTAHLRPATAWAFMGFGLTAVAQFHLSWVLLPPYVLAASVLARKRGPRWLSMAAWFTGGAALPALLLAPTLIGGWGSIGGAEHNVALTLHSPFTLLEITAQVLSFASYEVNRFVGLNTAERLSLVATHWWLAPFALVLLIVGLLQPLALFAGWFRTDNSPAWPAIRLTAALTVIWIYTSYFFSIRGPQAHAFHVMLPLSVLYAAYVWQRYAALARFRRTVALLLASNVVFLAGLAWARWPDRSLYVDRALVQAAIDLRQDRLLGDRRPGSAATARLEPPDPPMAPASAAATDLRVVSASWERQVFGRVSTFDVTIANTSSVMAYVDIRYLTRYFDVDGSLIRSGTGVIKQILGPGQSRRWARRPDGFIDTRAASATLEIAGAEPVMGLPLRLRSGQAAAPNRFE